MLHPKKTDNPLASYYASEDEEGRLALRHGQVEFLTTIRFIERYLTPNAKIIEIGAGTGRYSRAIADMGYEVDAVELFSKNIDRFKAKLKPSQTINIIQGNALDLSAFADGSFDITLLLGPLYHLYTESDKRQAISEALRVTKSGGVVFAAYCISDGSLLLSGFMRKSYDIGEYINRGMIDPLTFDTFSEPEDIFEMVRKDDIDRLMSGFPVERLHYVGTDMFTNYMRDAINAMSEDEFALYLRYHFAICHRQDMVGISHHTLDVFKKRR
ncbi:MAG: class I SAM-dependent methyltransferase [Clostridiales bacterium]|nr:class I SAM-dependent methyltransferase [Clostridiales bacterium]